MQYNKDVYKSYFQTDAWAKFKATAGWRAERVGGYLALTKSIGYGQSMRYFPELTWELQKIGGVINQLKSGPIFSRLEFLEPYSPEKADELEKLGLVKSFEDVQPEWRQWVDVSKSEEEILAGMKPKGRYNINVAERSELTVAVGGSELVADFFRLYSFTANRTDFKGRGQKYFEELLAMITTEKVGEIILIQKDGQPLAGGIFLYFAGMASYLYGGSQSIREGDRSLMAPYLLHWTAMKRAKAAGCAIYDLLAIAPNGADETHPYAGLTRFKSQFGGQAVQLLGSYDLVHSRFWYTMYRFAERMRRRKNTQ